MTNEQRRLPTGKELADHFASLLAGMLPEKSENGTPFSILAKADGALVRQPFNQSLIEVGLQSIVSSETFPLSQSEMFGLRGPQELLDVVVPHLKKMAERIKAESRATLFFLPMELPLGVEFAENGRAGNVFLRFCYMYAFETNEMVARFDCAVGVAKMDGDTMRENYDFSDGVRGKYVGNVDTSEVDVTKAVPVAA